MSSPSNQVPWEVHIVETNSNIWQLFDEKGNPIPTSDGRNIIKHHSKPLLKEIQAELKSGTPDQLMQRLSHYQLLSAQLDEVNPHLGQFMNPQKSYVTRLLELDGLFVSMHPPEEVERLYKLDFVLDFLLGTFGSPDLNEYLVSSMGWRQQRPKFEELRNYIYESFTGSSPEQKVVMYYAFGLSSSIVLALLFSRGTVSASNFALAAAACQQLIIEIMDEEDSGAFQEDIERMTGRALVLQSYLSNSISETQRIIEAGESLHVEFKATFWRNLHTGKKDKDIETASLKEITAFLNTQGGNLLIGVDDNQDVCGLSVDIFENEDRYQTRIANQINVRIGAQYGKWLTYSFEDIQGKKILRITCAALPPSDQAYLDGELYIRNAAQTVKLSTQEAIKWMGARIQE